MSRSQTHSIYLPVRFSKIKASLVGTSMGNMAVGAKCSELTTSAVTTQCQSFRVRPLTDYDRFHIQLKGFTTLVQLLHGVQNL